MNISRCFEPAPTPRFRGREASLAWRRSCHNGPTSAMSSVITSADRPVIRRLLMITGARKAKSNSPHRAPAPLHVQCWA